MDPSYSFHRLLTWVCSSKGFIKTLFFTAIWFTRVFPAIKFVLSNPLYHVSPIWFIVSLTLECSRNFSLLFLSLISIVCFLLLIHCSFSLDLSSSISLDSFLMSFTITHCDIVTLLIVTSFSIDQTFFQFSLPISSFFTTLLKYFFP